MKKLLFVINSLSVGGIQKSLVELLHAIKDQYEITLYCVRSGGEYLQFVPDAVQVLSGNHMALISEQTAGEAKRYGMFFAGLRLALSGWAKLFGKQIPAYLLTKMMGKIQGEYDIAISYSQPIHDKQFANLSNEIVLNCCNAKRKITFVHCDFKQYGGNTKYNRTLYQKFDAIAAVSKGVGSRFIAENPKLADKVFTVYNCVNQARILQLAEEDPISYSQKTIVTVARLSAEKGLLRCIPVVKRLRDEGVTFQWHIIGAGPMESELKEAIKQHALEGTILLHGEQINPYRYMKNADFFLLPSFHEAAPMVFLEAAVLALPVLTTNTLSAKELIDDRLCGVVCENSGQAIYEMLLIALCAEKCPFLGSKPESHLTQQQFECLCKG